MLPETVERRNGGRKHGAASADPVLDRILKIVVEEATPDRVILFGSRARNQAGAESDYDLLIVKSGEYSRRRLAMDLHVQFIGIPAAVDVLVVTPRILEQYKDDPVLVYSEALKEGVELYAA